MLELEADVCFFALLCALAAAGVCFLLLAAAGVFFLLLDAAGVFFFLLDAAGVPLRELVGATGVVGGYTELTLGEGLAFSVGRRFSWLAADLDTGLTFLAESGVFSALSS